MNIKTPIDKNTHKIVIFYSASLFAIIFLILGLLYKDNISLYCGIIALASALSYFLISSNKKIDQNKSNLFFFVFIYTLFYIFLIFNNLYYKFILFSFLFPLLLFIFFLFEKKFTLYILLNLLIWDLIFALGIIKDTITNIFITNFFYLAFASLFVIVKEFIHKNINIINKNLLKSEVKSNFEKEMIAFASHQLRSISNNFMISDEVQKSENKNFNASNELYKFKELSISSMNSIFLLLENHADASLNNQNNNIHISDFLQKITSFYKIKNSNLSFLCDKDIELEIDSEHKNTFIRSIFLTLDLIEHFFSEQKILIKIDFKKENDLFYLNYLIKTKNQPKNLLDEKIIVLKELLQEELDITNSEVEFGQKDKNTSFIRIVFKKMNVLIHKKQIRQTNNIKSNSTSRLLIAEDDEINLKIYTIGFEKYFGEIDVAANGNEVMKKLERKNYDLLIMDLQMPVMNGIDTILKIRELEKLTSKHLLAIGITANVLIYNKQDVLKFGFDDYFIKPFKIKDIYNSYLNLKNKKYE
jgi:CheY-like chemotaxis protein